MTYLIDQLRLSEKAAEDIYFARIDRELIEILHRLAQVNAPDLEPFNGGSLPESGNDAGSRESDIS